jgi:hypothetical protein
MTRTTFLLVVLALAVAWLGYLTRPPFWQSRVAAEAAIAKCKDIKQSDQLDVEAIRARLARCEAMEAELRKRW